MSGQLDRLTENYILNALPNEDYYRLLPHLKKVKLPLGKYLIHSQELIENVYFPDQAMASIVALTPEGQTVEVGVVGREGMVGIDILLGVNSMLNESMIQLAGDGWQIKTTVIRQEFKRGGAFHDISLRYIHTFMAQVSQTALCNRLHTINQRLARWLLMCHDRLKKDELKITQEFLSIMLATNRPSVTKAALALQSEGFIKYSRGIVTIFDRQGLENYTCHCYKTAQQENDLR